MTQEAFDAISTIDVSKEVCGYSTLSDAMILSCNEFEKQSSKSQKVIYILTDGLDTITDDNLSYMIDQCRVHKIIPNVMY